MQGEGLILHLREDGWVLHGILISHPDFRWGGIVLKPSLQAWVRQVWVPLLPDPAVLWWRKVLRLHLNHE